MSDFEPGPFVLPFTIALACALLVLLVFYSVSLLMSK